MKWMPRDVQLGQRGGFLIAKGIHVVIHGAFAHRLLCSIIILSTFICYLSNSSFHCSSLTLLQPLASPCFPQSTLVPILQIKFLLCHFCLKMINDGPFSIVLGIQCKNAHSCHWLSPQLGSSPSPLWGTPDTGTSPLFNPARMLRPWLLLILLRHPSFSLLLKPAQPASSHFLF